MICGLKCIKDFKSSKKGEAFFKYLSLHSFKISLHISSTNLIRHDLFTY